MARKDVIPPYPRTPEEWGKVSKGFTGSDRMTKLGIRMLFQITKQRLEELISLTAAKIEATPGMPYLITQNRGKSAKEYKTNERLKQHTKRIENWLLTQPDHADVFGNNFHARGCPTPNAEDFLKQEAARGIVFAAKEKVQKETQKEEVEETEKVVQFKGGSSTAAAGQESVLHSNHRLLTQPIMSLTTFNIRLIDSRTNGTITRVPILWLIDEGVVSSDLNACVDGGDICTETLITCLQDVLDRHDLNTWASNSFTMTITRNGFEIKDDITLATEVNDFINGPRGHYDLCITLSMGEVTSMDNGSDGARGKESDMLSDHGSDGAQGKESDMLSDHGSDGARGKEIDMLSDHVMRDVIDEESVVPLVQTAAPVSKPAKRGSTAMKPVTPKKKPRIHQTLKIRNPRPSRIAAQESEQKSRAVAAELNAFEAATGISTLENRGESEDNDSYSDYIDSD